MKANKNSLHARLYKFTYTSELPKSLCPYFWKLVFGIIVFIPNFIIQLPSLIMNFFQKDVSNDAKDNRIAGVVLYMLTIALCYYIAGTFNWVKAMLDCYSYNQVYANVGWLVNTAIGGILIGWFIGKLKENYKSKRYNKPIKDSIIKEFIKAKMDNYCPKIDWE